MDTDSTVLTTAIIMVLMLLLWGMYLAYTLLV